MSHQDELNLDVRPRIDTRKEQRVVFRLWPFTACCIFLTACSHEPTTVQARQDLPTSIPNLSDYDDVTRQSMELACIGDKTRGPVPYGACLDQQIASLQRSSGIPKLTGYDDVTRQSMELACIGDKTKGPAPYAACLRMQIESLGTSTRPQ